MAASEPGPGRLAAKLAALAAAALGSYLALLLFCGRTGQPADAYLGAHLDKLSLLQRTEGRRLVLVGGSNVAFSVDSGRLGAALGVPVVNMGLHGGLGLGFMLDSVAPLLREGDLVAVMPEYEQLVGRQFGGSKEVLELFFLTGDAALLRRVTPAMLLQANLAIQDWAPGRRAEPPYVRSGFDARGDLVVHLAMPDQAINRSALLDGRVDEEAVAALTGFVRRCQARGVRAAFLPPGIARTDARLNGAAIARIEAALRRAMPGAVAASPGDFFFDDGLFFNSVYHMNARGRAERTGRMIEALRAWVGGP